LSGTPTNDDVGSYEVSLSVTDAGGLSDSRVFTIDVSNVNDKPVITSDSGLSASQGSAFSFTLDYEDIDLGDTHTFGYSQLPIWLQFDDTTGTLSGTPTNDDVGSYEVSLSVTDAGGLSDSRVFTMSVENPFAWVRLFHWDGSFTFAESANRAKYSNLSVTSDHESFVDLNFEDPTDSVDLSNWTNIGSVSLRSQTNDFGHITVSDIVSSIQAYLGVGELSVIEFASADINGDGSVQVSDIVASIQLYLGLSELDGVIQFIDPIDGERDITPVIGETLDLTAVLIGDVDGSWSPEIV
jgi:PKD repeat protein